MSEIKCPRVWDDILGKMLYSRFEQFDDSIGFRFSEHLETENPKYMWPTGLHDKNGKEIYEGDAWIPLGCETPRVIVWHRYGWWFQYPNGGVTRPTEWTEDGTIIGNIYEHPHLLEKGAEG